MFRFLPLIFLCAFYACSPALAQTYVKGPALIEGTVVTATAGGNTVLDKDSQTNQIFSGTLTQLVSLPNATTLPVGRRFYIANRSSDVVTVEGGSGTDLKTLLANSQASFILTNNGSSAGAWDIENALSDASQLTGIVEVENGGTGLDGSAAPNGSLLIGNGTGFTLDTIDGTTNQITVTNGVGGITISGPQDLAPASSPTFVGATLSGFGAGVVHSNGAGLLSSSAILLGSEVSGVLPVANGGSNKALTLVPGGILWTDADSFEISAAGTSGQLLTSGATGAPTWSSVSTLLDTTYFKQGGNSFTAAARLGTNDSNVLEFETNNTLVGTFSTGGLFAIGASAPTTSAKLDIQGTNGALLHARLTTTQKNALTATAGMEVYDSTLDQMQCYVNGAWGQCVRDLQSSDLTLTASDTLAISLSHLQQTWLIKGNSGPVTMSTTPFGSTDPVNGAEIVLIGNTDADSVTFVVNDAANGIIGYGFTLGKGMVATVKYNSTLDRYVVKSISN